MARFILVFKHKDNKYGDARDIACSLFEVILEVNPSAYLVAFEGDPVEVVEQLRLRCAQVTYDKLEREFEEYLETSKEPISDSDQIEEERKREYEAHNTFDIVLVKITKDSAFGYMPSFDDSV